MQALIIVIVQKTAEHRYASSNNGNSLYPSFVFLYVISFRFSSWQSRKSLLSINSDVLYYAVVQCIHQKTNLKVLVNNVMQTTVTFPWLPFHLHIICVCFWKVRSGFDNIHGQPMQNKKQQKRAYFDEQNIWVNFLLYIWRSSGLGILWSIN